MVCQGETEQSAGNNSSSSKLQNKFAAVFTPRRVEEPTEPRASNVVLHVSRIRVVEKVEHSHPYPRVQVPLAQRQRNRACNLDVKRRKAWETIDVTRTDVCTELILDGVRKSRVQFIYGDKG